MREGMPKWVDQLSGTPDTLEYHRQHPEVTPDQHMKIKGIELANTVLRKIPADLPDGEEVQLASREHHARPLSARLGPASRRSDA